MARISLLAVYPVPPGERAGWSLAAYAAFFGDAAMRASLGRSLILAAVATLLALLVAFPLASTLALRVDPARRGRRLMLLMAPFWTSEVLRMFGVTLVLANRGALNTVLRWAGLTDAPLRLLYGNGAVLAGMLYTVLLTMLLPLYAALERMRPEWLAAAASLGARPWARFWCVTLPLGARGVASGVLLTYLACLGLFAAPALLGGPRALVFSVTIADLFGASSGRWPLGAAFGIILLGSGSACAVALAALAPTLHAPTLHAPGLRRR